MLLVDIMSARASTCASTERGTCTAIWSPSKSALYAAHTSGWSSIALPSMRVVSYAWMPKRWRVGGRLERALVRAGDRPSPSPVVEESVDRLLEHAFLVADDDVGGIQLHEPLQPVVAVDHPSVEVVQVGGRETPTVERHERTQVGRDHRNHLEDHPLGAIAGVLERGHHLEALRDLLPARFAGCLL